MAGTGSKLLVGCGVVIGGIVGLLMLVGLAIEGGFVPDANALPKGKLHPRVITQLRELEIIESDEEVQFFYSAALFSIEADGNLFTDKRAISYQKTDEQLELYSATYQEIASLEFNQSDTWVDDSTIVVTKEDGEWFALIVSTGAQGDELFFKLLEETWQRHRK